MTPCPILAFKDIQLSFPVLSFAASSGVNDLDVHTAMWLFIVRNQPRWGKQSKATSSCSLRECTAPLPNMKNRRVYIVFISAGNLAHKCLVIIKQMFLGEKKEIAYIIRLFLLM